MTEKALPEEAKEPLMKGDVSDGNENETENLKGPEKETENDAKGTKNAEKAPDASAEEVKKVTFGETFYGGLTSTPTIILMLGLGMSIYGKVYEEGDAQQSWACWVVPLLLILSLGVGSALVTKLENSEWRRNLRAEVAAQERQVMAKSGIEQRDLNVAAFEMGITPTNFGQG
ncbi:unnamed protein product [Durusdinium trenchii]|uniref:Uncharacterized protein n=2 Tax=Durusdinium trenchii TaxID=1381693 RepID=A0ABP0S4B8_9DINO